MSWPGFAPAAEACRTSAFIDLRLSSQSVPAAGCVWFVLHGHLRGSRTVVVATQCSWSFRTANPRQLSDLLPVGLALLAPLLMLSTAAPSPLAKLVVKLVDLVAPTTRMITPSLGKSSCLPRRKAQPVKLRY